MKTKFILFAMAAFCLASCNKERFENPTPGPVLGDGDYVLEIYEAGGSGQTKSNPSTVELSLANLVSASSKNITAQLKKRSGSSWVNVDSGVSYSWSASSADNQKFSGSGTYNQTCNVSAKAAGSGIITVSASLGGSTVATQAVPVTVTDGRALSWTDATTSLTAGEVKTAVLNSNFSGTVTISSDNSSFLVGTSENSLTATSSVTFTNSSEQTIYYKYTGSTQTTVKIKAAENTGNIKAELSVSTKVASPATLQTIYAYPEKSSCYINETVPVRYVAKYSDGSTKDISFSDLSDFSFWFEPGEAPTEDWQAEVHNCFLYSTGFIATNAEEGSLLNLAGKLTGSSYSIECDLEYTENGKTVKTDFYIEVKVEIVGLAISASGTNLYGSKPQQRISFYPKFQLRTGDGSKTFYQLSSEAKELIETSGGDYGISLRGAKIKSWEVSVDDCQSADVNEKTSFDLFVTYPGLSMATASVTYDPFH